MKTLTATCAYGQTGAYIARITGRDSKFTFAREFIGRANGRDKVAEVDDEGIYMEVDIDKKGRKSETFRLILECPDLPLIGNVEGTTRMISIPREEAMQIAKLIDAGWKPAECAEIYIEDYTEEVPMRNADGTPKMGTETDSKGREFGIYLKETVGKQRYQTRVLSPAKATAKAASQTVDSAVNTCWLAMQSLPITQQKKVLASLKLLVTPAKQEVGV